MVAGKCRSRKTKISSAETIKQRYGDRILFGKMADTLTNRKLYENPSVVQALQFISERRRISGIKINGGTGRNRTGVQGFAVLCIATLPPRLISV